MNFGKHSFFQLQRLSWKNIVFRTYIIQPFEEIDTFVGLESDPEQCISFFDGIEILFTQNLH